MNKIVSISPSYWFSIICLMLLINASGLLSPVLNSNDAYFYALIAKSMVTQHNWIDLYFANQDWLDKPHFPFWMTAISFEIFGINPFAYVLPGFIFHLIGAFYTYKLAKYLYDHETGVIAALIYVSSLHLLLSAMDIRAEAYLLGEIIPACYYWLKYDRQGQIRPLLVASFFTACAMMTKGVFVVVTIFSGILASWLYTQQINKIISQKWLVAYVLCFIFILPELISLYLQFDLHPEKVIFGQAHVSGLKWYFWGSQFGRFFNNGPIINTHGNPFFFIHTFLWAFLPWSLVFITACYAAIRNFKTESKVCQAKKVYLFSSFWLTFILFSATKFQLDHYTNIIMPFAAILSANYIYTANLYKLALVQKWLSILILALVSALIVYLFKFSSNGLLMILPILLAGYILYHSKIIKPSYLKQTLYYPVLAICCTFLFLMFVNIKLYPQYAIGYNVAKLTNKDRFLPIYLLGVDSVSNNLSFHATNQIRFLNKNDALNNVHQSFLLINQAESLALADNAQLIGSFNGLAMEKFIPALFNPKLYEKNLLKAKLYYLP